MKKNAYNNNFHFRTYLYIDILGIESLYNQLSNGYSEKTVALTKETSGNVTADIDFNSFLAHFLNLKASAELRKRKEYSDTVTAANTIENKIQSLITFIEGNEDEPINSFLNLEINHYPKLVVCCTKLWQCAKGQKRAFDTEEFLNAWETLVQTDVPRGQLSVLDIVGRNPDTVLNCLAVGTPYPVAMSMSGSKLVFHHANLGYLRLMTN